MIDFTALADECNADCRFEQAGWHESADSIAQLMESDTFSTTLGKLATHSRTWTLKAHVAALYACRLSQQKAVGRKVIEGFRRA